MLTKAIGPRGVEGCPHLCISEAQGSLLNGDTFGSVEPAVPIDKTFSSVFSSPLHLLSVA